MDHLVRISIVLNIFHAEPPIISVIYWMENKEDNRININTEGEITKHCEYQLIGSIYTSMLSKIIIIEGKKYRLNWFEAAYI